MTEKYQVYTYRPVFAGGMGSMGEDEQKLLNEVIRIYKAGHPILFKEYVHRNQWHYFDKHTKGIPGEVELEGPLPTDWTVCPKKQIRIFNRCVHTQSTQVLAKKGQFPFLGYKRVAKTLDKHFITTYGTYREHERECVMQVFERLQILNNSIYSRPGPDKDLQENVNIDYIFPIRNDHVEYRNIEGTNVRLDKINFLKDQNLTLPVLYNAAKKVHCWIVLDDYPFNDELIGTPSEKVLWPIFFGLPFIYVGSKNQMEVLQSWGIEPNDPYRNTVRGVAEQMLWLRSIFDDPILAQKWQDSQGELITKNRHALDKLPDMIYKSDSIGFGWPKTISID
jgi:hypothetical protein|tara:strand:+ start:222 stop:1229 length:1008 start_codon:yes stop_codon:yes gene_type:complete